MSTRHGAWTRSQPLLPRAGMEGPSSLPALEGPDSSRPAHRPLDFCSQSSTHRSLGHQPGQSPHPVPGADGCRLPGALALAGSSTGWGRRGCYRLCGPEERRGCGEGKGGRPTSPNQSNSKPSLPSELIRQQLYLFHLSNYHIIKCMNYKRAKALN